MRRVVEAAGMSAHCDFTEQSQSEDKKPDLVVRLPGDRFIIVDAKVPDLDFLTALESADAVKRADSLTAHAAKLKATIKALADRESEQVARPSARQRRLHRPEGRRTRLRLAASQIRVNTLVSMKERVLLCLHRSNLEFRVC